MRAILLLGSWTGWLLKLGGPGLLLFGLLDNSVIPTPGGMDLLTILLAAGNRDWWWYYALWATAGSLLGGYVTLRIGRKGGKPALEKRFSKQKVDKIYQRLEKHNFAAIFIPALLPPPIPLSPFVLAAGAGGMTLTSFFLALAPARAIRYSLFAWLGSRYGRWLLRVFRESRTEVMVVFAVLCVLAAIGGYIYWRRRKRNSAAKRKPAPAAA